MSVYQNILNNYTEAAIDAEESLKDGFGYFIANSIMENNIISSIDYIGEFPEGESARTIETKYYWFGRCAWYRHPKSGEWHFDRITPAGEIRPDGFSTKYNVIRLNGETFILPYEDLVIALNSPNGISSRAIVYQYADRWNRALRAVDNQLERAALGDVVYTENPKDRDKLLSVYRPDHSRVVEVTSDPAFAEGRSVRRPLYDARESALPELRDVADWYKNQMMSIFGYAALDTVKRAQISAEEVDKNDDQIVHGFFGSMLYSRNYTLDELRARGGPDLIAVPMRGRSFTKDYNEDAEAAMDQIKAEDQEMQPDQEKEEFSDAD